MCEDYKVDEGERENEVKKEKVDRQKNKNAEKKLNREKEKLEEKMRNKNKKEVAMMKICSKQRKRGMCSNGNLYGIPSHAVFGVSFKISPEKLIEEQGGKVEGEERTSDKQRS